MLCPSPCVAGTAALLPGQAGAGAAAGEAADGREPAQPPAAAAGAG